MKHIFIINPVAGSKNSAKEIEKKVKEIFKSRKDKALILLTQHSGHATELAREHAKDGEPVRFYSCGGDGTMNEVLNGMYTYENAELAVYPSGSGNDFVKMYGDINDITLESLVEGTPEKTDILKCDDRVAANIISVGFDAAIADGAKKFKKIPLIGGSTAYFASLIYNFLCKTAFEYEFVLDGVTYPKSQYHFGVAANGSFYGGGFKAAPMANMNDGYIDFIMVKKVSRLRILSLINDYKKGTHVKYNDIVKHVRCKAAQIKTIGKSLINLDGEIKVANNPKISIIEKAVSIIRPKLGNKYKVLPIDGELAHV